LSNGQDDDNSIAVYDWKNNKLIVSSTVDKSRVTDMAFKNENEFVTIGLNHIKFWSLKGRNLTSQKGLFDKIPKESLMSMTFAFETQTLFTGDSKGNIILWTGRNATKSIKSHNGSTYCLYYKKNLLYSGGQDGTIKIYNNKFEIKDTIDMSKMTSFNPGIRSLDMDKNNKILVGLKGGDVNKMIKMISIYFYFY
jgi:microtubule-associated protein-like 6